MAEIDYTAKIYDYLRTLGDPGDEVMTAIRPWLEREFGLSNREAQKVRSIAMRNLTKRGMVERVNVRGRYVHILK